MTKEQCVKTTSFLDFTGGAMTKGRRRVKGGREMLDGRKMIDEIDGKLNGPGTQHQVTLGCWRTPCLKLKALSPGSIVVKVADSLFVHSIFVMIISTNLQTRDPTNQFCIIRRPSQVGRYLSECFSFSCESHCKRGGTRNGPFLVCDTMVLRNIRLI